MKTHELAKALMLLARALEKIPDQSLDEFVQDLRSTPVARSSNIPVALSTLVTLSAFDKAQWEALIEENRFPIQIRPRDASRDVLGKLLTFLEQNPDARQAMVATVSKERSKASPELMRALQQLLKS